MSWGYWGIVGTLVAMVGMLLVCLTLFSSKEKDLPPIRKDNSNVPRVAPGQAPDSHRQAA